MITLSVILSIVWIVFTTQALYRRFFKKYAEWDNHCTRHLNEFQFFMPEISFGIILFVISCLIVKYLP